MGAMDNMGNKGKGKQASKENGRLAQFGRSRKIADFPWHSMGTPLFAAAIGCLGNDGAAVMIGAAQGGKGCVLSIYQDGDKHRTYCSDAEELQDWCHDVIETFAANPAEVYIGNKVKARGE